MNRRKDLVKRFQICNTHEINPNNRYFPLTPPPGQPMNYESFQWNFSSSTNPEIAKSVLSNKCIWIENDGIKIWQSTLVDTYMQRKIHVLLFISFLVSSEWYVGKTSPVGSESMSSIFFLNKTRITRISLTSLNLQMAFQENEIVVALKCNNKK